MNEKTKTAIESYLSELGLDEFDPSILACDVADKFHVSYRDAMTIIMGPSHIERPIGLSCHYCGMEAVGFGAFDEQVCRECGG